ncbi:hypothetical protein C0J52_18707 [Blattella germanica]|nr:hypothetical protein C0J52_18707 [Blattella germanica]
MIRPETLMHSNQAIDADFRAPVRLQAKNLHCGLGMNGYYWEPDCIQRFATHRVFVAVLAALGLIQGASMGYFAATANVYMQEVCKKNLVPRVQNGSGHGWPIISTLMFIAAVCVAMFPKQLPSQAVKEMAASIVDLARGVKIQEPGDPRLTDPGLLRPPLVALHIMVSGLVISRTRMRAGRISGWHAIIAFSVAIFMFSRIFTNCNSLHIEGETKERFDPLEVCNRECNCPVSTKFSPVCSQEGSFLFYSPCHAGCERVEYVDDVRLYSECNCVRQKVGNYSISQAKGGPCSNPDCNFSWVLNQCFTVMTAALVGMRLVGNAIITFRSVQPQDKALAVGLELTLVGLIAYIPGNLIYQAIAGLMLCCAALSIAVWYFARNLDLYREEEEDDEDDDLIEMREVKRRRNPKISSRQATPAPHRRWRSGEDVGSVREEIDRMKQASEPELRFDIMDISDHMDDSMEVTPYAQRQVAVF